MNSFDTLETEKQLALIELTAWAEKHLMILAQGRSQGVQIGASIDVINFIRSNCSSPNKGEAVCSNLVPISNFLTLA